MSKAPIVGGRRGLWVPAVLGFAVSLALVGRGGGAANVTGKVTHDGKDVTGGTVQFSPTGGGNNPGKAAAGPVENGTYKLDDKVPAGKAKVTYQAPPAAFPEGASPKPGDTPPKSPYEGLVPKATEVDIKAGSNKVDIELVAPGK